MVLEEKLLEILKYERRSFYITLIIIIVPIPFVVWFVQLEKNINYYFSILAIILVYLILGTIFYYKWKIVAKLKWSLTHYVEATGEVQNFLKMRKSSLKSYHGVLNLYYLYDDALKLLNEILIKKYA